MYLATAGERLRLHGTDDYKRTLEYKPRFDEKKGIALDVSFSDDGRYFGAVCNGWSTFEIMRFDGNYEDINLYKQLNMENPTSIAFSKMGEGLLAVGNREGIVASFNFKSKEDPLMKFPSCKHKVTSLDFSSSDSAVAAGTTNGEVYICGIKSGKLLDKRELNWREGINSVKFHHSRKGIMAACCSRGSVSIWDINVGIVEKQFLCHESPCKGIVFSPSNITFMASVGYDLVLNFFDIRSKSIIHKSSIPEAGSSLDIHCDGTTLAVGTVHGAVYIYDARRMRAPREKFSSLSGCINRLVFQPSALAKKRRSRGPQTSLKKQIFKPVHLEHTGSSSSSCDSLFSPVSTISEEPQKKILKRIENPLINDCFVSPIRPSEEAPIGNATSDDSSEAASSDGKSGLMKPIFSCNDVCSPSIETSSISPLFFYKQSPTMKRCSSQLKTPNIRIEAVRRSGGVSVAKNFPEGCNRVPYVGESNVMQCSDISPVCLSIPWQDHKKSPSISMVKTPMKTPKLLDFSTLNIRKMRDGCRDSNDDNSQNHNLLSFMGPLTSTRNESQNVEVGSPKHNTPNKVDKSLQKFLSSTSFNLMQFEFEEAKSGEDFPISEDSEREILDILNKYTISEKGEDESSGTTEESEMEESERAKALSLPSDVNRVVEEIQEEEERDVPTFSLDMKKYMDDLCKDMCYELKKAMSTMHIFNVSAHSKQEILLHKILSELRKEKVDKCVGTEESFYQYLF